MINKRPIDIYREEKNERDTIYNNEKVKAIRIKRMNDELVLAKARDELILKSLVEKQAAYLVVSLKQKILTIPQTYARRILNLTDSLQASRILKEMAITILKEVKDLPLKITDPHWLETLESEANDDGDSSN